MNNELLWQSDLGDGRYKNPIIFGDYSDPDVIRVGDTYYMTASSFSYTPGLPILVSKDLVNWELKNYAIKNLEYERYHNPAHSKGIWAPALRYHNNLFWISYGMPDEGIFMIYTEDPLGQWSEPILLLEGKGYIDPCPFWDDDGRAYIVHGYAKSRIGFKSIIGIFEIANDGRRAIGSDSFIYDGTKTQPTIEGPKVYKREGWYYIFAPAGGVTNGWQMVLRSRSLEGPYEEKIVMSRGGTPINGPHQGGLIDTPMGEEWFIHFQDRACYGRIAHLQPVKWVDEWPVIGVNPDENGCGEPCLVHEKPKGLPICVPKYLEASDDFTSNDLGLQWQWLGNHHANFYSLLKDIHSLRLFSLNPSGDESNTLWRASNVLTQKILCPSFKVETLMSVRGMINNEHAGIVMMGGQYAYMAIKKSEDSLSLVYVESQGDGDRRKELVLAEEGLDNGLEHIYFKMTMMEKASVEVSMEYSFDGLNYHGFGKTFIPTSDHWVGSKIGLFALALDTEDFHGYADFGYIYVESIETEMRG